MNDYLVLAAVGWLIAIPLALAAWHSPDALLNISRRMAARSDALKASRALYKSVYASTMSGGNR